MNNPVSYQEERCTSDYRLFLEYMTDDNCLSYLEMRIQNDETEHEEEIVIYGHISYEANNYICSLSDRVDIREVVTIFTNILQELKDKLRGKMLVADNHS